MKIVNKTAADISDLPTAQEVQALVSTSRYQVTLPVVVLSLFRDRAWNAGRPGILLVSDFTANGELLLPGGTPYTFTFDNTKKRLSLDKIFSISVSPNIFMNISNELKRVVSVGDPSDYDFYEFGRSSIDKEKIVANVTFALKTYNNKIEASMNSVHGFRILENNSDDNEKRERILRSLDEEEADDEPAYRRAGQNGGYEDFDIDDENDDDDAESNVNFDRMRPPRGRAAALQLGNAHKKVKVETKIEYSQVADSIDAFSQEHQIVTNRNRAYPESQFTQETLQPNESQVEEEVESQAQSQLQDPSESQHQLALQPITNVQNDRGSNMPSVSAAEQPLGSYQAVNPSIIGPEVYQHAPNKVFEIEVLVRDILPEKFIIKPYGRTLKIAPFKIFVEDPHKNEVYELQFLTEVEICNFLGLKEIEESLENLPLIESLIEELKKNGEVTKIRMQKRIYKFLSTGARMKYWTCLTPLNEL